MQGQRTTLPRRVQRTRKKGWRMPPDTVYVGRPTRFGNPYQGSSTDHRVDYAHLTRLYRDYLLRPEQAELVNVIKADLQGKDLACWCPLDKPCHADVLLQVANSAVA